MLLDSYLQARRRAAGESVAGFARRARVPQQTLQDMMRRGRGCNISTAYLIVTASRAEPAPDGSTVGYEDLVPELNRRMLRAPRRRKMAAVAAG